MVVASERLAAAGREWLAQLSAVAEALAAVEEQLRIHQPMSNVAHGRQLVLRFVPGLEGLSDVLLVEERGPRREVAELRRLGLTEREAEILRLMTHGATTSEVARHLGVASRTVSKHLQNTYQKLGVPNRTSAIASASDAIFSFR